MTYTVSLEHFMDGLVRRNPAEAEFHQAVYEVAQSIFEYISDKPIYAEQQILERLCEPDRIISFRVGWQDDAGNIRNNRGWRVQHSNAIGPYKGGLRFHPSVNQSILKFLAFEQTFKNSLTGQSIGGAKGGSNFNPKGKSDAEIMRFCQAFMTELSRYIGPSVDVPAGDIGVGAREIGYMFGQYKRLSNSFVGVLTGKGLEYGGSLIRSEATGYGVVLFALNMLKTIGEDLDAKTVIISGAGNVAIFAAEKALESGAKVVSMSDSSGTLYDSDGLTTDKLNFIKRLKFTRQASLEDYMAEYTRAEFFKGKRPWHLACDVALPCATQNEINEDDAKALINNGCRLVAEGANMPSDVAAVDAFLQAGILFAPSKAANAGGVAVSALEMSQNSMRTSLSRAEVSDMLSNIMADIHTKCENYGRESDSHINYVKGANIAGFIKVASAMMAYGVV